MLALSFSVGRRGDLAREAHDREDLLRDARGLSPRVELLVESSGVDITLFAGFRGASASLYFGQDAAFHFNNRGELRRAYLADELIKADGGRLVAMRRERSATESALVSRLLTPAKQQALLAELQGRLAGLTAALAAGEFRVVGQVPAEGNAVERLRGWLTDRQGAMIVARSPRVG